MAFAVLAMTFAVTFMEYADFIIAAALHFCAFAA
eukprot:CAMPEP_0172543538 /NCGR_PEP_ID=MMETSP1067-20121228/13903_1 /TAXON_ID=265564 ORGANISM="Thalassiosira punctigera, Strain Tpunct2005C2" /NCGR_SAMPLE_ID=MMETSP1067 /ASSEMBLY_ACC=CAM_ASM_000444 /LENGTH=33 /DNA_ID= /DNA_START= /DNA_END= /DNA_ORIENTATION=